MEQSLFSVSRMPYVEIQRMIKAAGTEVVLLNLKVFVL